MGRSFRVGSIFGVDIKVHPTFVLIVLWIIYQWGIVADAGVRGIIFGTAVVIAVFGCVLAHELAHGMVAMRHGLKVEDITLLPIGGVARIEHVAMTPRMETVIALAGPAMNFAIAAALTPLVLIVAVVTSAGEALGYLVYPDQLSFIGFIIYLWIANIILAAFNLAPAFPMDGGRILRAQLARTRSRLRATQLAVGIGQMMAISLAIVGFISTNYLLLFVAAFILIYAQIESRYVYLESRLRQLPVGQFALWDTGGIHPRASLAWATRGGPRDLVVTENGQVVGMLWRRDLLRHLNGSHHDLTVRDIMDRQFHPVHAYDSVYDVHLWLSDTSRSAVPVIEDGQYRGIFTGERLVHVYQTLGGREWLSYRNLAIPVLQRIGIAPRRA
ncbi:MAG: site-2 protease family protein [Chloroflexota bacterium]